METPAARPASLVVEPRHGGQILVDALLAHGVDMAFGVPGESYLSVLEGFYQRRDRARFIVCRQEGGAGDDRSVSRQNARKRLAHHHEGR